jgi:xanthine dehydrogenase YagR molybdenum-binding subunit
MTDGHLLIGMGMATACYPTRRSPAGATARVFADGTALVEAGTQDLGTGTYTIMTQVAADALGLPLPRVTFRLGDTMFPETPVSGGSQTAASVGSAVDAVSRTLRGKAIALAIGDPQSPLYRASATDVVVADGRLFVRSDEKRAETYQALLTRHGLKELEAQARSEPGDEKKQYAMYGFGAQFAEVHVDADLGQIRVARLTGVFGTGRILNAKTARSQFLGGMVFGVGMALYEHTQYDERLGRIVNNNLAEYHVPVNADIGSVDVAWIDEQEPHANPIGVKGIGEIGTTGVVAAIANAVYHATGKRVRDLPITLDRVL